MKARLSPLVVMALVGVALITSALLSNAGRKIESAKTSSDASLPRPLGEKPAPDFLLPDLKGKQVRLSDYRGKVVLVDFWATWCPPCRVEIPHFKELFRLYQDKGFEILAVSMDENPAVVQDFVRAYQIPYTVVIGDQQTAEHFGGIPVFPTTFVIDRQGRILRRFEGYSEDLLQEMKTLIQQVVSQN